MEKIKSSKLHYVVLAILTVFFLLLSGSLCKEPLGIGINVTAILVMAGIILWGIGIPARSKTGIASLKAVTNDLNYAQNQLDELLSNPDGDFEHFLESNSVFEAEILVKALEEYRQETARLSQSGRQFYFCDISDYFNSELLETAARSSFNNLVGGMMTGFGILGTFIGLTLGLQDFRNSSATEMMESIGPLMEGIKVAFLTSIYGMIFSLLFNWYYHDQMAEAEKALNAFLDVYHKAVPRTDHEGMTQMLQYQAQQTKSMEQFAEDISLALTKHIGDAFMPVLNQIDLSMKAQAEQLPQAVSAAIGESVVPTLTGIENTISQLAEQVAETQHQNMGKIAEDFVAHMDAAMGSQLEHLGDSIRNLCEWQETASENMKNIADRVSESGEKLGTINEDLQASIHAFEGYMTQLETAQTSMTERFDTLLANFSQMSQHVESQNSAFEVMLENENQSVENLRLMSQETAMQIERLKEVFQAQQNEVKAFYQKQREELEKTQEMLLQTLHEQQIQLSDTLSKQAETTSSAIQEQSKRTVEAMEAQTKQAEAGIEQISCLITKKREEENLALDEQLSALEDYINEQKNNAVAVQKAMEASLKTQEEALENALRQQAEHITSILNAQSEQLKQDIAKVDELQKSLAMSLSNASTSLDRSAHAMTDASTDLTQNLDSAMERTYRQIDKQLAEVVRHLSGTLSEIRNTTEKVPQIIQMSADQSQEQTNSYLRSVADSQSKLSESVNALAKRIDRGQQQNNRRGV